MKLVVRIFKYLVWKVGLLENHDLLLLEHFARETAITKNSLLEVRHLFRYSQADEVGILEQLLERLEFHGKGRFVEFGIGDGTENNSLDFLLDGWEVWWFGNENLAIEIPAQFVSLKYTQGWITRDEIYARATSLREFAPNIVSMDLDGNDYHFTQALLESGLRPEIWVQEYNAQYGPNAKWIMPYDESHFWDGSTYWGASLSAFAELFALNGYVLITCNLTGVNAFFIREDLAHLFSGSETSIQRLYRPYKPWFLKSRQRVSSKILHGCF